MKNFKKIGALLFLSSYLIICSPALAADSNSVQFTPQISIPGTEFQQDVGTPVGKTVGNVITSDLIGRYVAAFYKWGLSIVGVLAVLMLMAGGLIWLTSGGDSGKIGQAKKMIGGSLLGSLLLVGAYFFLNTINPDLTKLPAIELTAIQKIENGCCDVAKDDGTSKITSSDNCSKGFSVNKVLDNKNKCVELACCIVTNYAAKKTTSCLSISAESCKDYITSVSKTGSCSNLPECANNKNSLSCIGVEDGDAPTGENGITGAEFYCYGNNIYEGAGKIGEPCGNEKYSKCDKDEEQNGKNCDGDFGGRDCGSGLWCCKFDGSGKRINK